MSDLARRFTQEGNEAFVSFVRSLEQDPARTPPWELLVDSRTSSALEFEATIELQPGGTFFANRHAFGTYLAAALAGGTKSELSLDRGLWNWLALYYFDQLCPVDATGRRSPREPAVYYLAEPYEYHRYYRHLVRSPWLAVTLHPLTSRVILIPVSTKGPPLAVSGEIFEQVASRQGLFRSAPVMNAIDLLYFNPLTGRPRMGTAGSAGGSPSRLGKILKQFELTFDLEWSDGDLIVGLLPAEFDTWIAKGGEPRRQRVRE